MKILVLDGTEDAIYYKVVSKYFNTNSIDYETSVDRASSRIINNSYDLVVMSKADGRMDLYDLSEKIVESKLNKKCEVILMLDGPTMAQKIRMILRGRGFRYFRGHETSELCAIFERD